MKTKTLSEINEIYDVEIDRIVGTVKGLRGGAVKGRGVGGRKKVERVLLQFPEGMKPYSQVICDEVEGRTGCQCFIWIGSCFGACDLPLEVERLGVDLIIQFGHSAWEGGVEL